MGSDFLGAEVFGPTYSRKVASAWESFMVTGECEPKQVRNVILKSWQRCSSHKVAQAALQAPLVAQGGALGELLHKNRELRIATREVVDTLGGVLDPSKSLLMITDPQGIILDIYGDPGSREAGRERHIAPGGIWNEQTSGTNAVGTALAAGMPIQVHSMEHFCEGVKAWTCSAALVHDPVDRSVIGVLDISGFDQTFHLHSLALATSIASQIDAVLRRPVMQQQLGLLQWCTEQASSWHNDGYIVLDNKGRVVSVNKYAQAALRRVQVDITLDKGVPLKGERRFEFAGVSLPDWVRQEWLQPATPDRRQHGILIVIPHHQARVVAGAAPVQPKKAQAEPAPANPLSSRIIGESEPIRTACNKAKRLAAGDFPVLILGQTGVGKEEFASAIHQASPVANGPFVAINCSVLGKDLVGSELFGYADGAFTGARRGGRVGRFEEAHGGTLFLDEIGELPLDVQAQLLRVLQDGVITRLGENRSRKVSVRILSATHCDLQANIALGSFREDLYYRLAITTLTIPPLRARRSDIAVLSAYFLDQLHQKYGTEKKALSAQLIEVLNSHAWPGNVRELKGVLESMWHLSDNTVLLPSDLPDEYRHIDAGHAQPSLVGLARTEREAILDAMAVNGGSILKAARQLGIARSTLYEKIKKYGIEA
jgi:transcriptional regulator of acetoin/glycerol metabolism